MITVKIEAVGGIKNLHPTLWKIIGYIASRLESRRTLHMRINSTDGGSHMSGSLHYLGRAADFTLFHKDGNLVGNRITEINTAIADMAKYRQNIDAKDVDLVWYDESNYYHIEYDPKGIV